jgi:hypothetical protein
MSIEGIIIGLLAIGVGLAWAFYGLKLFTILLPLWAFFFGLVAGAQWGQDVFGQGFFTTVLSWIIGLVVGIVLAAISFFWYYAAIVILGGAVGYALGVGFFDWLGLGTGRHRRDRRADHRRDLRDRDLRARRAGHPRDGVLGLQRCGRRRQRRVHLPGPGESSRTSAGASSARCSTTARSG